MKRKSTNQPQGKPTKRLALPRALVASPFVPPRQVRVPAARALGEKKGMDTAISFAQINSTVNDNSGMIVLNLIQQGAGSWNRVGKKVNLRSLRIRGDIIHQQTTVVATGSTQGQVVRCVISDGSIHGGTFSSILSSESKHVLPLRDCSTGRLFVPNNNTSDNLSMARHVWVYCSRWN